MAAKQWKGTTFGNSLMHQWLIRLLKGMDIRIIYIFTYVFVIPPCVFRPGFKPIYHYFRTRWRLGPIKAFAKTYQNHCLFAQVVIDRFAMYAGRQFHMEIEGDDVFQRLAALGIAILATQEIQLFGGGDARLHHIGFENIFFRRFLPRRRGCRCPPAG